MHEWCNGLNFGSYLRYGNEAAGAEIFKVTDGAASPCLLVGDGAASPCLLVGYEDMYKYSGETYKIYGPTSASNFDECRDTSLVPIKIALILSQEITVAEGIEYQNSIVETAWPLGTAIEAISSLPKFNRLMYFI
ncbi:hypothetical protein V8G54_021667 [Vigna mungo]|uniref:Apyrase n=1 Tax=Vigna mungo TaxID=3915 RepID=A0AAQ3NEK8_VIGMU